MIHGNALTQAVDVIPDFTGPESTDDWLRRFNAEGFCGPCAVNLATSYVENVIDDGVIDITLIPAHIQFAFLAGMLTSAIACNAGDTTPELEE